MAQANRRRERTIGSVRIGWVPFGGGAVARVFATTMPQAAACAGRAAGTLAVTRQERQARHDDDERDSAPHWARSAHDDAGALLERRDAPIRSLRRWSDERRVVGRRRDLQRQVN